MQRVTVRVNRGVEGAMCRGVGYRQRLGSASLLSKAAAVISFLTTNRHSYTLKHYLEAVPEEARNFTPVSYRDVLHTGTALGSGPVIFADIERLSAANAGELARLWETLHADPNRRLLNHPTRSMKRYELLRSRYQAGLNDFNVYRLVGDEQPQRWPVFVRNENDHDGPLSPLLFDARELQAYDRKAQLAGEPRELRLVVEMCDTRDQTGLARKYSAFRVAGAIVPRHVFFSQRRWSIKEQDLVTPELLEEERRYLDGNPHEAELRQIFDAARIDYGRIDYALKDGRIQVWEINTNPMLVRLSQLSEGRAEIHTRFCQSIKQAFARLSDAASMG